MSGLSATIPERESLYLDLLRATSAILVVLGHAPYYFDVGVPRLGPSCSDGLFCLVWLCD